MLFLCLLLPMTNADVAALLLFIVTPAGAMDVNAVTLLAAYAAGAPPAACCSLRCFCCSLRRCYLYAVAAGDVAAVVFIVDAGVACCCCPCYRSCYCLAVPYASYLDYRWNAQQLLLLLPLLLLLLSLMLLVCTSVMLSLLVSCCLLEMVMCHVW